MEDDEKKKRKKDENPYQLKEEFPDTINIKPKDEQPEAPAVEAPAEETPTDEQPEAPAAEAQEVETPTEGGGDGPKRVYKTRARKTEEIANDINANSDADFVQRLKDKDRKTIPNWENPEQISTHKMSYAKQDGKTYVYPDVQNIDGELHDFTNPEYGHGKWDALDSALKNGDAVQVRNRRAAERFTTQYKDYYPKGDGEDDESDTEEVEKTDGQDVDGATGVVSQKTGNAGQTVAQNTTATPTTVNAEDVAGVTMPDFKGIREEMGYNPNAPIVPANNTEPEEPEEPEETDDEVYQRLIEQYGDEEAFPDEYAKYKRNAPPMGTEAGGGAGGTEGGESGGGADAGGGENTLPQPPAIPNAEDDETVKGQEEYNKAIEDAYLGEIQYDENGNPLTDENGVVRKGGYFNWYDNLMKEREEYDRQRQERDSRNAFWRSIGEVGASLVNLLGVSGAFSGRNAYGRGAYSSMQKFDLTTPKLTDKMWADIDKRKERMDALKEKRGEIDLKFKEAMAKGKLDLGKGKGAAADKQYTREYTQYKDQLSAQQAANQLEYLKGKAAADAVLAEIKMKNDKEIAKIRAAGRRGGGGSGSGSSKTPITLNLTYPTADGEKSFTSRYDVLEAAMKVNFGRLADCLARALGYNDYAGFSADKPTDYKYNGDNQIEKSLAEYFKTTKYVAMNNISNEKMTELLNWAYNALGLTQEGGELIENAVKAYAPIVDVMNAMNGGGGGGDDTEDEDEEFPSYDGAYQGTYQ